MLTEEMKKQCLDVVKVMKNIAHPQRLMILCHLEEGERNVSELLEVCKVSQPQISQFLKRMTQDGLLKVRREAQFSYYSIADKQLIKLIQSMKKIYGELGDIQ